MARGGGLIQRSRPVIQPLYAYVVVLDSLGSLQALRQHGVAWKGVRGYTCIVIPPPCHAGGEASLTWPAGRPSLQDSRRDQC